MKLFVLLILCCAGACQAFGQGTIYFNNRVTAVVDARFICDGGGLGFGYTVQLFAGPVSTPVAQLTALFPTTTFRLTSAEARGYVEPVTVTVPGIPPQAQALVVMRAFGGPSFAESAMKLESNPIIITLGGDLLPPANLVGLQGAAFGGACSVPEPGTVSLAALFILTVCICSRARESRRPREQRSA